MFHRVTIGLAAALLSTASYAADQFVPEQSGYDWNGFYVGAGVGAGGLVHELQVPPAGLSFNGIGAEGIFGQITVGYDHMFTDRFLAGAFIDGRYGGIASRLDVAGGALAGDLTATYGFDAGVRLGYLFAPGTLGYAMGGYSRQHFDLNVTSPALGTLLSWDADGYFVGAGLETALTGNITLKSEYRYSAYRAYDFGSAGVVQAVPSSHTVLAGLNYRFGYQDGAATSFTEIARDWTGFYVGGSVGAGALVHQINVPIVPLTFNGIGAEGVFGELNVGYDHEFAGGWVAGVMLGGRLSSIATTVSGPGLAASISADYGFDVLARLGKKLSPSTLAYIIGGYSHQHFDIDISAPAIGSIYNWDAHGYSIGAGVETAVTERLTANLEYRYSAYSGEDFGLPGIIDLVPSSHTVRAGFKFKVF